VLKDGLKDAYSTNFMGNLAEKTAKDNGITRKQTDDYSI